MKRIAFLLLASFVSASVCAGPENWNFVKSVGGIAVGDPFLSQQGGWVLPVRADVSGRRRITTDPTTLNSGVICEQIAFDIAGRNIYIAVVTAPAHSTPDLFYPNNSSRCPYIGLGEMLPGKYSVFYRGPSETPVHLGDVFFGEDGPVDTATIAKVIGQTDKIVVFDGIWTDSKVLFSSTSIKDIAAFNHALAFLPPPKEGPACACAPVPEGPTVRLYRGGTELVLVTNVNKNPVAYSRWGRHAILVRVDRKKWLRWFDARNIPTPPNENDARARNEKGAEAHQGGESWNLRAQRRNNQRALRRMVETLDATSVFLQR